MSLETTCLMPSPQLSLTFELHVQADKGVQKQQTELAWHPERIHKRLQDVTSGAPG